jgi:hypothetical protein
MYTCKTLFSQANKFMLEHNCHSQTNGRKFIDEQLEIDLKH